MAGLLLGDGWDVYTFVARFAYTGLNARAVPYAAVRSYCTKATMLGAYQLALVRIMDAQDEKESVKVFNNDA